MDKRLPTILLWTGAVLFVLPLLLWCYLLSPMPGSQTLDVFALSYYLDKSLFWTQILGGMLLVWPLSLKFKTGRVKPLLSAVGIILLCGGVWYMRTMFMNAERMFYKPVKTAFLKADRDTLPRDVAVLGVSSGNVHRAYPMYLLSYHHQIHDTLAGQPLLITYCIMCRSARVFVPKVKDTNLTFRLVGMNHFNAILEDEQTGSWWPQASGIAEMGPMKGDTMPEWPGEQMSLSSWLAKHPDSDIFQIDTENPNDVSRFKSFDKYRASLKGDDRDWVAGVVAGGEVRAYPWKTLVEKRVINDTLDGKALVVAVEPDSVSFHVWSRIVAAPVNSGKSDTTKAEVTGANDTLSTPSAKIANYVMRTLTFAPAKGILMIDLETNSLWNHTGRCVNGPLSGAQLKTLPGYQEYWHSWQRFHPTTTKFR